MFKRRNLALAAVLTAATMHQPGAAQSPTGCRGTTSQTSSFTLRHPLDGEPVEFPSYPVISGVQPGSPAERAGMRAGDVILMQDGRDLVGQTPSPRVPAPGDTVRFLVRREGAERTLTVVMGRWDPPQDGPGVTRRCVPVAPSTEPA